MQERTWQTMFFLALDVVHVACQYIRVDIPLLECTYMLHVVLQWSIVPKMNPCLEPCICPLKVCRHGLCSNVDV